MKSSISYITLVFTLGLIILWSSSLEAQQDAGLPEDFPEIQVNVWDNPEDGYIFITPCGIWGSFPDAKPYLAILDNYGTPVFYEELDQPAFDFKRQPNGNLSFYGGGYGWENIILDKAYNVIGTSAISGYSGTDFHDFHILDNGNHLLLGYEDRLVDMSTIVPGGQPGVTVRGALIQEKNTAGNVIWQWTSWDHYEITDTDTAIVDLTGTENIDYVHANAIELDADGNLLISCRNMHEVTKINRTTGDIIWRMGGSQNQFEFIGEDTIGFSGQHDIRRLDNGNYLLFDNGWHHPETVSSAYEFTIDEENLTVTTVKRYRSQPEDILGWIMGGSQRLPGGNTLVGWGSGVPNVTEFKPDGTKALEFEFESVSYRAFKFPWETSIMSSNIEEANFGEIYYESTQTRAVEVTNLSGDWIILTWMHCNSGKYECITDLPLSIGPGGTAELTVRFSPGEIGEFNDILTLYAKKAFQPKIRAFAVQIVAHGSASEDASIAVFNEGEISIFPNPCNEKIFVSMKINEPLLINLYNGQGQFMKSDLIDGNSQLSEVILGDRSPGLYIIQITGQHSGKSLMKKIIKE